MKNSFRYEKYFIIGMVFTSILLGVGKSDYAIHGILSLIVFLLLGIIRILMSNNR